MESHADNVSKVLILTVPRTASHVLERMVSQQPNAQIISHPLASARRAHGEKLFQDLASGAATEDQCNQTLNSFQECFEKTVAKISSVEKEGKIAIIHEHLLILLDPVQANQRCIEVNGSGQDGMTLDWTLRYPDESTKRPRTNLTMLPDDFLTNNSRVVMPIRHPALSYPGSLKLLNDIGAGNRLSAWVPIYTTLRWQRNLFDWLLQNTTEQNRPIVVHADDFIEMNSLVTNRLCNLTNLNADALLTEWPAMTEEAVKSLPGGQDKMFKTLFTSSGLVVDQTKRNVDIDVEMEKWKADMGLETAEWLREVVESNMADYEYLLEYRIR